MGEIFGDEEATRIAPGIDVITGGQGAAVKEEKVQPAPPDVTLDEVGTKLDLARAYIDMGDPDGAKSILEEVLTEGDDRQKDEAQQLMDGVT
jgi:pilus assembly protein FimV